MNAQEIFDTVAKHLAAQGRPSRGQLPSGGVCCMYRGPRGTKCAVGCLITDEEYRPEFEGKLATQILPARLSPHRMLLQELQDAHDDATTGEGLVRRLGQTAETNGLSPTILDTLTFPELWR